MKSLFRYRRRDDERMKKREKKRTICLSFFTSRKGTNMYKGDEHMEKALVVVCQKLLLYVDKH